jgi:hypothetical protein
LRASESSPLDVTNEDITGSMAGQITITLIARLAAGILSGVILWMLLRRMVHPCRENLTSK